MSGYNLSVSFIGAEELKKALDRGSQVAKEELAKALNKAANDAHQEAVNKAPHQSGRLWGSIHTQDASPDNLVAKVGTKLDYALYQERGTGLYGPYQTLITPKNAKAMMMVGSAGSSYGRGNVYAWFKSSKGTKPKWYMKQALEAVKPKLTNYLQEA